MPHVSPSAPLRLELRGEVAVVAVQPILQRTLLRQLVAAISDLAAVADPPALVLCSEHPTVFLAGADLAEIAELDPGSCLPYAALGRSAVERLASYPSPSVAAVHGSCSGGGVDLALACDALVVGPHASFEHPGIRRGLVTGWTGTLTVPAAVGRLRARGVFLAASPVDAVGAVASGLATAAADEPFALAVETASRLRSLHPERLALWRLLRSGRFVDRFRASVVHK